MSRCVLGATIASILLTQAAGVHHPSSDLDDTLRLREARGSAHPDIWLRPGMKRAKHLRVQPPSATSAMDEFPEAFDWDTDKYSPVFDGTLDEPKVNVLTDVAVLDHELVKLNAYCGNVRRVQPFSINVGVRNVSGCAAHARSTSGCSSLFAYGFADGWCDCVESEAGTCRPSNYVTYNVYRLTDSLPARSVRTRLSRADHLLESPRAFSPTFLQEPEAETLSTEKTASKEGAPGGKTQLKDELRGRQEPPGVQSQFKEELRGVQEPVEDVAEDVSPTLSNFTVTQNGQGDLATFGVAAGFNVVVITICLLCFSCCRKSCPPMYNHNAMINQAPFQPSMSFCGWIQDSLRLTTDDVWRSAGLDQAMFLEYLTLALKILVVIGLPLCLAMVPLHIFLGGGAAGDDRLGWLGMANIDAAEESGVVLLWAHGFIVWAVVIVSQLLIFNAMGSFMGRRWAWMKAMPEPRCCSVIVENIPPYLNTDQKLKDYFNRTFGKSVVAEAFVVKFTKDLRFLCEMMRSYQRDLAHAESKYRQTGIRPELKTWFDEKHDAISYDQDMIQDSVAKIHAERARIRSIASGSRSSEVCSFSGFVTFYSVQDASTALNLNYTEDGDSFRVSIPPDPSDVIYTDLMITPGQQRFEELIGYFWLLVVFLTFIPMVLFIAYFANFTVLTDNASFIKDSKYVTDNEWVGWAWNAIAGVMVLTFIMSFVPMLLGFIFNGWFVVRARTALQQKLQSWGFSWTLFYVLFITSVGSSLYQALKDSVSEPYSIFQLYAATLPLVSHFYFSYIMLQWSVCAFELTRWYNLFKFEIYAFFNEENAARVKAEPEDPDWHGIGSRSARATLSFVVVLVFCQISPIICLLGLVLFAIMRLSYGYLLVFSESVKPDLGGAFWVTQLKQTQLGVFFYIILMTAVLAERAPTWIPSVIALASLVPMLYAYLRFDQKFKWDQMPVEGIVDKEAGSRRRETLRHTYEQPEMCEPLPDYSGQFPLPSGKSMMDDFGGGLFKSCGTHPTDNRPNSY